MTFTLLDNSSVLSNYLNEPTSLELIRRLDGQIMMEVLIYKLDHHTIVLYLENHTNYFNETVFVYHNVTQTDIDQRVKLVN
jgi:hypothetical protein